MNNRYFWIKDRLEIEGIKVQYCPTDKMLADFFTKPLQGNLFRKFRDVVMGYKHVRSLDVHDRTSADKERVRPEGNQGILKDYVSTADRPLNRKHSKKYCLV